MPWSAVKLLQQAIFLNLLLSQQTVVVAALFSLSENAVPFVWLLSPLLDALILNSNIYGTAQREPK